VEQKRKTILVVEDDHVLRETIADALEWEQYSVIQVGNAMDAMHAVRAEQPDMILLDLGLPGRSGIEVLEAIKQSAPTREIPVLIMSGYAMLLTRDAVVRQADGTLAKPFDLDELLGRVNCLSLQRATER
jgi:CheY-like chemotaxis protein